MSPVETPSLAATAAMRVAPKPRSITTWRVTSRISLRRASTVGLRTPRQASGRTGPLPGSPGLDEAGAAGHHAIGIDDAQLDQRRRVVDPAGPRPASLGHRLHGADVHHLAVAVDAHQAVALAAQAVRHV